MIVVFGSINLDFIFALPTLPAAGDTVLAPSVRMEAGGKGGNQALAAARDGAVVTMAGAVGRDVLAAGALQLMREVGIDLTRVAEVVDDATGCAAIFVDSAGRNAIGVGSGANRLASAKAVEDGLLGPATTLLLQMEVPPAETAALIGRARPRGVRIVLNLAPAGDLPPDALRAIDLLLVNENEAAWLGRQLGTGSDPASLRSALGVDVVRTMGGAGADAATEDGLLHVPALSVAALDTTAAGDCFAGVLAAALDGGLELPLALRRAAAAAAVCCTRQGTQSSLPTRAETDAMLRGAGNFGP